MRARALMFATAAAATIAFASTSHPRALGKPGLNPIPCPQQTWQMGDPAFEALAGARAFFGQYEGGLYRIEIPANWNGELVLYAHGFVSNAGANGSNLRVGNSPIREHLIKGGYAWAASSYRCNGYVPGQGLLDTMALTDLFTKFNDGKAAQRVLLTGTSMGGHVTLLGMHEFPTAFAGGLAMCPAGSELFDFFAASSAAAEVITGVQFGRETMAQDVAKMNEILGRPPDYTPKGRQLASVQIQISGGPRPFAGEGLASGGRFSGNFSTSGAVFTGSTTPSNRAVMTTHIKYGIDEALGLTAEALNGGARRKALDAEIRSATGPFEEVVPFDGKIERPLLTMHGTGDLFVPIFLQQTLKRAVVAAGKESLLAQRIYRIAGHCGFSQPEMIRAFDDLAAWVHRGVKPEGDEVLGDLSNAGLKFTSPLRPNDPGTTRIMPAVASTGAPSGAEAPAKAAQATARVDFGRDVQPILRQSCYSCHGPTQQKNGFRLDRRSDAMRGSTVSPGVIRPGSSEASLLFFRIAGNLVGPQMPPTGALPPEQIATIKAWIDQGAEWPDALAGDVAPPPADPRAQPIMEALRAGNAQAFRTHAREAKAGNLRGPGGTTPLMYAVLYGTGADVKLLLDGGADPNVKNDAGATALMWAVNDIAKTQLLVERGADVNARSADGRTPLLIASGLPGAAPVVKLLLDRGAKVDARALGLFGETTPLAEAAFSGDAAIFRLLSDHGAEATGNIGPAALVMAMRAKCQPCIDILMKKMPPEASTMAMLFSGPPLGPAVDAPFLLEKGADASAKDPQGRTTLMLAAASDAVPVDVAKALIARGVDVNAKTADGQTALGHARLRGHTALVDLLLESGATDVPPPADPAVKPAPATSPRAAIERTLPLLQKSDTAFLKTSGCVSCHNNTLTAMTVAAARAKRIPVDEPTARENLKTIATFVDGWRERAYQGVGIPGDADTVSYILLGLGAEKYPADAATDSMAHFLKRQQLPSGHWRILAHRPPIESNDIQVTAASMRALQLYAPKARRADYDKSIQLAAAWLAKQTPHALEERAFQLLGLGWAGAGKDVIQKAARALLAEQRADGGWAQLSTLTSDAYATGQALVALTESGALTPADPAYAKGVQFLLNTQFADGSWFVRTRAIPLQPLFEIGFPHGRDQWISAAATNWAALALSAAVRPGS